MARVLTAGMVTEIRAKSLSPRLFMKAEFDSGDLKLWTGASRKTWDGNEYTGGGNFLSISPVTESKNLQADSVNFVLSAIPTEHVSLALTENYQGRLLKCWFACLDGAGEIVTDPFLLFKGRMDVLQITDSAETSTLTMRVENLLIDFRRAKLRRYTDEDQKSVYPNDRGLEFVNQIQDKEIVWGKATPK